MDAPPGEDADEVIVARCQRGDYDAFAQLYERYRRPMLAYIYQITRNYDESASIAQDVFLRVFAHIDRCDVTRRFSTWLYAIARNASIDFLQARNRRVLVDFSTLDRDEDNRIADRAPSAGDSVEAALSRREASALLHQALGELPHIYREIIELVIFQERSYEDVAEILGGISLGTLRSRMFHALRRLRTLLQTTGGKEGQELI